MSPLRVDELSAALDALSLARGDHVLDVGAGRGELARLVVERHGARVTAVDRSAEACARARAATSGLPVEVIEADIGTFIASSGCPRALGAACAVGSVHAFGSGRASWERARESLAPLARVVLVADLVALGERSASCFDLASLEPLSSRLGEPLLVLPPSRVLAYERAWCAAVEAHLTTHPHDPRNAWAIQRLEWSRSAETSTAFAETAFAVFVIE